MCGTSQATEKSGQEQGPLPSHGDPEGGWLLHSAAFTLAAVWLPSQRADRRSEAECGAEALLPPLVSL